ncbi:MAG: DUF2600 family protein [Conexibacter sp.]
MAGTLTALSWRARLTLAVAWALPLYWLSIFPRVRLELRRWRIQAHAIPDPVLREHALHKLHHEHLTAEGAAAFALLATARSRRHVVRICVAFEVMYDFIDALAEESVSDVLRNNRQLYRALAAAFMPGLPLEDYYAHHSQHDDGGYLGSLIDACRLGLVRLRSHEPVLPALDRLTWCAAEAQSLHHAAAGDGQQALACWAAQACPTGLDLHWWEIAAGAGSPLGIFALVAAASRRSTTAHGATEIERAYFPWIAALSWLLESLVDVCDDADAEGHSYIAHYDSPAQTAARLAHIAARAAADARALSQPAPHHLLLAGMVGMNLSHPGAEEQHARAAARAVHAAIGGATTPLLAILRLRRRLG